VGTDRWMDLAQDYVQQNVLVLNDAEPLDSTKIGTETNAFQVWAH
jgi:hypothetical protein